MVDSNRVLAALVLCGSVSYLCHGTLRAQAPLSVAEVLALRSVVGPQLGDGFVAFQQVVERPIADGPGSSYLHVGVIEQPEQARAGATVTTRWLLSGNETAGNLAIPPGQRAVSYTRRIDGNNQILVQSLNAEAGEVYAVTPSVQSYRWRPDGGAVAFTALDAMPAARAEAAQRGFRPIVYDEDWRHVSLWMVTKGGEPERLTEGTTVFDFQWSHDGNSLVCACAPRNTVDASYMQKRLHVLPVATKQLQKLVDNPGKLGDFAFTPDGSGVVYVSAANRNDPHAGSLFHVPVAGDGAAQNLSAGFLGMVEHLHATSAGILLQQSIGVYTRLLLLDSKLQVQWTYQPKEARLAISGFSRHGQTVVFAASHANHPAELFLAVDGVRNDVPKDVPQDVVKDAQQDAKKAATEDAPKDVAVRLTNSNPSLQGRAFGEQRVVRVRTRDGLEVQGLLLLPIGYQEGARYPLVIVAHGGPESHFSDGWLTSYSQWGHLLAARGIVSWYPNYRSSTGYGVAFCMHDHGDPMGKEFDDHLDAIAHFDQQGLIDRKRVGIGGGSYGGYTAAWAATKASEHFAAAVSFVPFVDMRTKWLTSDIPMEFYYVHYQEKWPWQQPGLLADRSPLTWAQQCATPLLLLGGTSDPRVHPSQPHMLYRAVKFATDTPVRYVQYEGEGHGNRSNVNRMDYALRTLRWFEHYLLGDGDRRNKALPPLDVDYPK